MEDSWSWDGSLVSLHSSMAASTRSPSPTTSGDLVPSPAPSISPLAPAVLRTEPTSLRYHTPPAINTRPPSPVSRASARLGGPDTAAPHAIAHEPLTSLLLSQVSPPASPVPSTSSYPYPRSRVESASTSPNAHTRPGRGRTRTRKRTGASGTASNDGSAIGDRTQRDDGDDESGTSSVEDGFHGLVMPSLTLDEGRTRRRTSVVSSSRSRGSDEDRRPQITLLVLGKTAEDRRTLSALLANDEEHLRREHSSAAFDLSCSFVSSERSHHARTTSGGSESSPTFALFTRSGSCGSRISLAHPATDEFRLKDICDHVRCSLEQLEAKLERTFPSTESLASLVGSCGVGDFDAALFLFSSPPSPCEIARAKTISHLLPILPILILPPSPTAKPQKTTALSNAVVQQLDLAGVRWLSIDALDRRESRSPARKGSGKTADICGGPISMLPHDLFVQHPPSHSFYGFANRDLASTPTTSFPSPSSEPTSLTASQELPPLSPTFTAASSSYRSSSSRASSTRSLSPSSATGRNTANLHHLTLLDLHRLRRILHSQSGPDRFRRARAETFLEWREVEVASRGFDPIPIESLPTCWNERPCDDDDRTGRGGGRRGLDFSKRVAERRKTLRNVHDAEDGGQRVDVAVAQVATVEDDGDVLDMTDDEEDRCRRRSLSMLQDPTTPKPCLRHLPASSSTGSTFVAPSTPTPTTSSSNASSSSKSSPSNKSSSSARSPSPSYFPPFPSAALSASVVSLAATTNSSDSTDSSSNPSISLLRNSDPFHLPSLLHLVGLNLRLALFRPHHHHRRHDARQDMLPSRHRGRGVWSKNASARQDPDDHAAVPNQHGGWWKTFAVFGVVFAAGVVAGIQVVDHLERSAV